MRSRRNLLNKIRSKTPLTIADYVRDAIRSQILHGDHPLGAKLDQQALAEALGVSVIPVRESLRQLEAEGLVRIYPRRGAFVADLSLDELQEIYLIREVLEALATRLAVPHFSPRDLETLAESIEHMEEATVAQDFARLLDLNRTFHFTIYNASGRPLLLTMIEQMWGRSALYRRLYTYLPERAPQALAEHQAIYAACQKGNAGAASEAIRNNVRQTVEGILQSLGAGAHELSDLPSASTQQA